MNEDNKKLFSGLGDQTFKRAHELLPELRDTSFRALFGASAEVCADI